MELIEQYRASPEQRIADLERQLAEARRLFGEWRNLACDDPQWKYDDLFERTDTFNLPAHTTGVEPSYVASATIQEGGECLSEC